MPTSKLPDHLGGQFAGNIDLGIVCHLQKHFGVTSLVDIGCGDGAATLRYAELGIDVVGIDGDWTRLPKDDHFVLHDFTKGPLFVGGFDLAYSIEFLEHVEEQYIPNFMPQFAGCRYAVVTAALPGQRGHHHVNCQPPEYWIDVFRNWELEYDDETTQKLKSVSTLQKASGPRQGRDMKFFARTGMFFRHV